MANEAYRPMTAQDLIKMYGLDSLIADRKQTKAAVEKIKTLEEVSNSLKNFAEEVEKQIEELEKIADGKITTYYYSGVPTLSNFPASEWTVEEYENHIGDMYYDKETGDAYKFLYDNETGEYLWRKEINAELSEALAKANAAQDTADRKRQIFVEQPYPPYQVGDLWLKDDKDIYRCRAERTAGEFSTTDWKPASDYTNDEYAKGVKAELDSYKEFVAAEYVVKASFETSIDDITAKVESNTTKIENAYNLKASTTGNPIRIEDAGEYDIDRLYLEGNSYQETTSGKNLLPISTLSSQTTNGITFTNNNNGTYTLKGTASGLANLLLFSKNANLKLKSNQHYTLSVKVLSGKLNFSVPIAVKDNNGTITYNYMTLATPTKLTDKEYDVYTVFLYIPSGTIVDCTIALQIEEGSTATEYEPYTNGPSPNPDYPQEIEVIEGSVDVEVVGKNILNLNELVIKSYQTSISNLTSNSVDVSSTTSTTYINSSFLLDLPVGSYTLSCQATWEDDTYTATTQAICNVGVYEKGTSTRVKYFEKQWTKTTKGNRHSINFTIEDNELYDYKIVLYPVSNSGLQGRTVNFYNVMINEGTTLLDYESYKSTTASLDLQNNFLAKIGDVKDEIDVVTGKLTKRIGKVVLDSSNMSVRIALGTGDIMYRTHKLTDITTDKEFIVLCNRYKGIKNSTNRKDGNIYWNSTNKTLDVIDNNSNITTIEEYETWLASNNVTVYYVLAEPYEVQLDTNSIRLFKGINNISINANLEPSYVSLTYLVDNAWNSQYATKSQLQVTQNNINSVVEDTTILNADLIDLQAVVETNNTNLNNTLTDLKTDLDENYVTNTSVVEIKKSVSNIQTSLSQQIEITKDIQVNGTSKVKTSTGFTFDESGLSINKTGADTNSKLNEDGLNIKNKANQDVLYGGYVDDTKVNPTLEDGSSNPNYNEKLIAYEGQSVVYTQNNIVDKYLVVGNHSRFEDYEDGTGCFIIR